MLEELLFGTQTKTSSTDIDESKIDVSFQLCSLLYLTLSIKYVVDRQPLNVPASTAVGAVWKDEDDERVAIDLNKTNRLKKLKNKFGSSGKSTVSAVELTNLLQERCNTTYFLSFG